MTPPDLLPIDQILPDLVKTLESNRTVLLQAPPGAGKTTRVPLALLAASWRNGRKILMLEPRRLAARSAANYMASQRGEKAGMTVGYRTRLDTRISPDTLIEVVTEGILTRMIQSDPALEDYAAVIFDEFHERSLQADLGLALVRESKQALREDLRLIIMSATLDTAPIAAVLGQVPVLTAEGRAFPVGERYRPLPPRARLVDHLCRIVIEGLEKESGSLLVFLPGAGEIRRAERQLKETLASLGSDFGSLVIAPLYGSLGPKEQDLAIAPTPEGQRKIVLATAIAESSLTIQGIRVVIDSGQQRRPVFDANSGMTRLVTGRVSKASAEQRKGRAGRVEPGVCYRLWSESAQFGLAEFTPPEIHEADLAPVVLELAQWGARSPEQLEWIDMPPAAHWQQAVDMLGWLDMLDTDGGINQHGQAARALGTHPRLAHMILLGREIGLGYLAAELAALLEERDLAGRWAGADMQERVRIFRGKGSGHGVDAARMKSIGKTVSRLSDGIRPSPAMPTDEEVGRLLALAYPDRVARKRPGDAPRYQLSNGRGAVLRDDDPLGRHHWLATAELDGKAREATIYLAAPIDPALLERDLAGHIHERDEALWDDRRGTVVARRVKTLGQLVLEETALPAPSAELLQQGLLAAARKKGLKSLPWTPAAEQWLARVVLLARCFPDDWPAVNERWLTDNLETWLGPFLAGMNRWADLTKLNLGQALASLLDYRQQKQLDELAPTRLTIPTGQSVTLDYTAENGPVLAAKLQALFGWTGTPTVASGRVPVVIHLLSPAQRPLAVTADLASFWQNAYPEVRKDMRGRYPKHPWPEDPLNSEASQWTKKRNPEK
jgi:ATP-dependent helicase HrpB